MFLINRDWYLIDLPGYGYAKRSKEERALLEERIYEYLRHKPTLALVIIDGNVGATELDLELISFLDSERIAYSIIANKIDKQSRNQRALTLKQLAEIFPKTPIVAHSVKTEEGRTAILEMVASAIKTAKTHPPAKNPLFTR